MNYMYRVVQKSKPLANAINTFFKAYQPNFKSVWV